MKRNGFNRGKNIHVIECLICGVNEANISMARLNTLGGYRFGLFGVSKFAPPTVPEELELNDIEKMVFFCVGTGCVCVKVCISTTSSLQSIKRID